MQKLIETLMELGIEVPQEKQAEVKKALSEHYKNVNEYDKAIKKLEADRDSWQQRAKTAEETLESFDGIDPANWKNEVDGWKKKAEEAEENAKKQIYERDFADALKAELADIQFTSEAAKRDVMAQITGAELKLKDGKILGLSDLIDQIKQKDATAFVDQQQAQLEAGRAKFTTSAKPNNNVSSGNTTKKCILEIKDPGERQKAMIDNHEWKNMLIKEADRYGVLWVYSCFAKDQNPERQLLAMQEQQITLV